MPLKFAFIGIRHGHIFDVYKKVAATAGLEIVATCEEDAAARAAAPAHIKVTHDNYAKMLDAVDCSVIAVGDYYSKRGPIIIEALKRGKHVITDKPLCIDLAELDQIEKLAKEKKLAIGCQLDITHSRPLNMVRQMIASGRLGRIHQIAIGAQHPLNWGSRPGWYFEKGKHGGTLNDIGIHAFHAIPWVTGLSLKSCVAARQWNAFATEVPHFMDSAQAMVTLADNAGLMIDVSYAMPTSQGYSLPHYWRCVFFGSKAVAETSGNRKTVWIAEQGKKEPEELTPDEAQPNDYLASFVREVNGEDGGYPLTTRDIIHASRQTLLIQQAADTNRRDVTL